MEDWSEYIAGLVGPLTDYWGRLELEILKSIAERMSAADLYTASSAYEMKKLLEMGMLYDEVLEILAGGMRRTRQQVESIIGQAGLETLREESERLAGAADGGLIDTAMAQRAYDFERTARQSLQRVLASEEPEAVILQQTIRAGAAATEQTFRNLTRTTALGASAQFGRALDAAYMQTTSGAFSATEAVDRAVRQLAEHGVDAVIYPSGHVDTVEVAARRAIITGANQTSLLTREEIAVEYDLDLVEVSAHWGARPEHAEWQGGIYSRSGKSSKYAGLVEATGYGTGPGLGGWNCSHTFSSYIEGMPRTYTDEQLEDMKNATVEVDGKKIPYYEAQQRQRAMERTIRGCKRRAATAESDAERYAAIAKEKEWRQKYERFCAQTGLKEQPERYQTGRGVDYSGYGRYITGESGGKRAKRAAELTGGFPAPEDGAGASVGSSDAGRPANGAAPVDNGGKSGIINNNNTPERHRTLYSEEEIKDLFGRRTYQDWSDSLSKQEVSAISEYTLAGYREINEYLRSAREGELPSANVGSAIKALDDAISRFVTEENITVFRGVDDFYGGSIIEEEPWNDIHEIVGKTFCDRGYSSATAMFGNSVATSKPVLFEMEIPAGTGRGAYINEMAEMNRGVEYEYLVARSSRFTITDVMVDEKQIPPKTIIKMRMITDV